VFGRGPVVESQRLQHEDNRRVPLEASGLSEPNSSDVNTNLSRYPWIVEWFVPRNIGDPRHLVLLGKFRVMSF
jgi:hypothetical protein